MSRSRIPPAAIVLALVALYALAQLNWYQDTPTGISPVLDGQENLILAQQIANGSLPAEPFYRAMLYPALLAFLPLGYSIIGLLCHLGNALLSHKLARQFWNNDQAGLLAAALVGFNPVLLHFAFDPLDTTLAITLFLSSLLCLQKALSPIRPPARQATLLAGSGLFISLATLARPHFLLTLAAIVALTLLAALKKRASPTQLVAFILALALPLLAIGLIQKSHSGTFHILPAQGSYNLWVSNHPSANGLYYQQSISIHSLGPHQNPALVESQILYEQANGSAGSPAERNDYWKTRTIESVLKKPLQWLKLESFKLYAAFNNFEQYNNKTYSFHKSLSPILRYNPIGWGTILALATFCSVALWKQIKVQALPLLLIAATLLAGLLIFMASARFRLPLVPLLAILAAGLPAAWPAFKNSSWTLRKKALIATAATLALSFSQFAGVASTKTYIQDALLLADASARIGNDQNAIDWARYALQRDPANQSAQRIRLLSQYNQIISGSLQPTPELWATLLQQSRAITLQDERLSFTRGVILLNNSQKEKAIEQWESGYNQFGLAATSCLAALELAGVPIRQLDLPVPLEQFIAQGHHWIYAYAIAQRIPSEQRNHFLQAIGLAPESYQNIATSLRRVFPQ